MESTSGPDLKYRTYLVLVATNVQVGQALRIQTDKPMYQRSEIATLTATYRIGDTPIEKATILFEVDYPNGTLYFSWTLTTDASGTATISYLIPDDAPYGAYTVYATAYKTGMTNATATTTFMVVHFEPELKLWFEGLNATLVNQNTTIILRIRNIGNLTAYDVDATLFLPSEGDLEVLFALTKYIGIINAGEEVRLVATVKSSKPGRYDFTGVATYTKEGSIVMPIVVAHKTLVYAYHLDYPVDLIDMKVSVESQTITVTLTVTNYGDLAVQVTLIASAQHTATKLVLRSAYQVVTIDPGETVTVSLKITIPASAPTGEYLVQGILATGLPNQGGFTLTYREQKTQV